MNRSRAVGICVIGVVLVALAYLSAFVTDGMRWGVWCMVAGIALLCVGCMTLGVARPGRRSGLFNAAVLFAGVALAGGFALALWLPGGESATTPLVLGFPPRAAAALYIVGVLPLFVLPLVYALTFDALTLTDDDLARVRAAKRGGEEVA